VNNKNGQKLLSKYYNINCIKVNKSYNQYNCDNMLKVTSNAFLKQLFPISKRITSVSRAYFSNKPTNQFNPFSNK
jgi:hypothetical protein